MHGGVYRMKLTGSAQASHYLKFIWQEEPNLAEYIP